MRFLLFLFRPLALSPGLILFSQSGVQTLSRDTLGGLFECAATRASSRPQRRTSVGSQNEGEGLEMFSDIR